MAVEQASKSFQDIQKEYDHLFVHDRVRDEDRAYAFHARSLLRFAPNARHVLDVACGGGYFFSQLGRLSEGKIRKTGTDISGSALGIAKRECPEARYLMAVSEALPFGAKVFDAVTCLGSLEHFLDIPGAIREMIRITQDDGLFYIMVPNMFWYKDMWAVLWSGDKKDRNQTQEKFAPWGEWVRLFEGAGLKVTDTLKYNGIAKSPLKQWFKDLLIPTRFSYHFIFICRKG